MKKGFSILVIACMMSAITAHAAEDEQCLNNCLQMAYVSQYCQEKCSDDPNPGMTQQQTIRQVEPHCVDDCTNSGKDSDYCTKACTY
jgi:hypothetical protein